MSGEGRGRSGPAAGPGAPRGAPGRVAAVHRQVRPTMILAALFTAAAPVVAAVPHDTGVWLPLHVFLVGGVLLAVSGATVLFAVTWGTAPPPPPAAVAVQRWLLAASALALVIGRERDWPPAVIGAAAAGVVAALVLLAVLLARAAAKAVQARLRAPMRFYLAALAAGVAGSALGAALATGHAGAHPDRLRTAHITVNVLGLVGLVIAGTVPFFSATQARAVMSRRATGRAQGAVLAALAGGVTMAAGGALAERGVAVAIGLAVYAAALVRLVTLLPPPKRKQVDWAGPRLIQLWCGLAWWTGCTIAGSTAAFGALGGHRHWPLPHGALLALLAGGYGQIVVSSLAYLGPVLRGGGHERLSQGFRITRSWVGLAAANVAAASLALGAGRPAAIAIAVWGADSVLRALLLLANTGAKGVVTDSS